MWVVGQRDRLCGRFFGAKVNGMGWVMLIFVILGTMMIILMTMEQTSALDSFNEFWCRLIN